MFFVFEKNKYYNYYKNEKESKEEIDRAFNLFDIDKTGVITFENLKRIAI